MLSLVVLFILSNVHSFVSCADYEIPKIVNVDEILKDDELLKSYIDCILGKGKCSSEAEEVRKVVPEALEDGCAKCTEEVKEDIRKVLRHIVNDKPEWLEELESNFDPNGVYKQKYDTLLKEQKS